MTAKNQNSAETAKPTLHGDADAVAASGMPLPCLRVLQTAGAIQAQKTRKAHGGFKRMWHEEDILIASIGAAMSDHFAWNIRIVAEAMAKTPPNTWRALTASIAGTLSPEADPIIRKGPLDWHLDLIDRSFLFLRVPTGFTAILPDVAWEQTVLTLGWATSKDTFQILPWQLSHTAGQRSIEKIVGTQNVTALKPYYKLAMAAHANALSTASINISMQVRATWRRLNGLDAHLLQHALPQKGPAT